MSKTGSVEGLQQLMHKSKKDFKLNDLQLISEDKSSLPNDVTDSEYPPDISASESKQNYYHQHQYGN